MNYFDVYIVECSDKLFHSGITSDIKRTLKEMNEGLDPNAFTYSRLPVNLVWSAKFYNIDEAILFEQDLRKWSRTKKQSLIDGIYKVAGIYGLK